MYGGGFATIPAYLRDMFGTMHVSAIHGRLLTAWSVAGVLGPLLVNYIREYQIHRGVAPADAYSPVLYIMAGLLVVGFICNLLVRPVTPSTTSRLPGPPARPYPRRQRRPDPHASPIAPRPDPARHRRGRTGAAADAGDVTVTPDRDRISNTGYDDTRDSHGRD